ncbi:hypothetical protein MMC26_000261 [Xylographa opegraphella]|nr:hypothetical protein [Xylographa opegraphella]
MFANILPIICTLLALSFSTRANVPSPQASVDLICHTGHVSECYPKTFQPSTSFQPIHDDQDLPAGLHVRLDLTTGRKEAKLNIADERDTELLPSTLDIAIVDTPEPDNGIRGRSTQAQKALQSSIHGPVHPPVPDSADGLTFEQSKAEFATAPVSKPAVLLSALETLEDLSHDIYWGLQVAQDSDVVLKLFSLFKPNVSSPHVQGAAALVFGTAIQNNPAAFTAALNHFYNDELPTGPMEAVLTALLHEQLPQLLTRFVYLLSALCQDHTHLWKFVQGNGLETLLSVFDASKAGLDGRDRLRAKIANFVLDHFLQQDSLTRTGRKTVLPSSGVDAGPQSGHEEQWVSLSHLDVDGTYQWPHEQHPRLSFNMAAHLEPWCAAFATSLRAWKDGKAKSSAVENVEEAHEALDKKLATFGCSCKTSCDKSKARS